jgi:uncharacterized protein DUF6461
VSDYDWVDDIDALTVTLIQGVELQQVGEALGVDWSSERLATFDGAFDGLDPEGWDYPVQVEELDGWLVVVEPNGWFLSDDEKLGELSREGAAVSVFRNINAQARVIVARRGEVVRSFDPVIPDYEPDGEPLPEESGLSFGADGDPTPASFVLLERVTGVRIEREWLLDRPRRTWLAPEPPPA